MSVSKTKRNSPHFRLSAFIELKGNAGIEGKIVISDLINKSKTKLLSLPRYRKADDNNDDDDDGVFCLSVVHNRCVVCVQCGQA